MKQIPDIAGSAETITRSCCLCRFPFAAKSDGEWDWHESAIAHSLLLEIYFCLCLCVSSFWHNSDKQQKDGAFPQINRDQSLNFDWMTKQNQLLKVCFYLFLTPASWQAAPKSKVPRHIEESSFLPIIYIDPNRGMGLFAQTWGLHNR